MPGSVLRVPVPAIAPSILTADFGRLREQVREAESAGVDVIHLDIMDGHFVPNITFGPLVVAAVREVTSLPLDVHLMIDKPDRFIEDFAGAGADILTFHIEATPHAHRVIQQIHAAEVDAGVALNPATPLTAVEPLLPFADLVLVMSVNPGFSGQSFIQESTGRVRRLREMISGRGSDHVRIEIDGGINRETIRPAADAGATMFVTGSAVFNDKESVGDAVTGLRSALESA